MENITHDKTKKKKRDDKRIIIVENEKVGKDGEWRSEIRERETDRKTVWKNRTWQTIINQDKRKERK